MPKVQTQLPREELHVIPQKKVRIIKMNYGKNCFDPKKDNLTFFNKNSSSTKKSTTIDGRISSGRNVSRRGTPGGNGHR